MVFFWATQSDEALLDDYLDISIIYDDQICSNIYLDKQTYKWIIIDLDTLDKVRDKFFERLVRKGIQMHEN